MIPTAPPTSAATRKSWHRVAEHVLAAGQYAAAGTIRLRPCPGGIETVVGVEGRQLAVVVDELGGREPGVGGGARELPVVWEDRVAREPEGPRRSAALTTIGAAAAFAGVRPG